MSMENLQENLGALNIRAAPPAAAAAAADAKPAAAAPRGKVKLGDFELLRVIGRGAFGEVRVVRMKATGEVFAMKAMRKSEMLKKKQVAHVRAERDVLALADCPWVVKLHYSFQDEKYLYLVMEYLAGGDFMTVLMKYDILTEEQTRFYVAEIALALESVHRLGYIHRDLKPDNILLDRDGHIKLSDFGLCKGVGVQPPQIVEDAQAAGAELLAPPDADAQDAMPSKKRAAHWKRRSRQMAYSTVGTPDYIAPEVFAQTGYSYAADLWSLGVIMYESLVGYAPFASDEALQTCRKIVNWRKTLAFPADVHVSAPAKDLIMRLMNERSKRFSVEDMKAHPFFDGFDWDSVRSAPATIVPVVTSPTDTSNFDDFPEDKKASEGAALKPEDHANFLNYTYVDQTPKRGAVAANTFEQPSPQRLNGLAECAEEEEEQEEEQGGVEI